MPSLAWNKFTWDERYRWPDQGEVWSKPWGSSEAQWFGALLPRIRSFLPANKVLEIAPGYGRWTGFLISMSGQYYGVDMSRRGVDYCRDKFPNPNAEFFVNDGRSLAMIPDGATDFVFSFDSLVHAERDVLEAYISQIIGKLSGKGAAFLHHSNRAALGEIAETFHSRATSVHAGVVRDLVSAAGGQILRQEIVTWGRTESLDCLTLFARQGDYAARGRVIVNKNFMNEAAMIRAHLAPWSFIKDA